MDIHLTGLGKKFNRDWIFKNLDISLLSGQSYAIVGPNGSGKSTLLKVIAGYLPASTGTITYSNNGMPLSGEDFYKHIIFAAPYLELIEEFTLTELLQFHFKFKKIIPGHSMDSVIELLGLNHSANKFISIFSSVIKQRVKLALAFFSESKVLFLDEPTVNLDVEGIKWYEDQIKALSGDKLILIASNQKMEYQWATKVINISECKM